MSCGEKGELQKIKTMCSLYEAQREWQWWGGICCSGIRESLVKDICEVPLTLWVLLCLWRSGPSNFKPQRHCWGHWAVRGQGYTGCASRPFHHTPAEKKNQTKQSWVLCCCKFLFLKARDVLPGFLQRFTHSQKVCTATAAPALFYAATWEDM